MLPSTSVMNPRMNDGGLSLSLWADLIPSRSTTGRDNRLHDISPGYVDGGIAISVLAIAALDTTEASRALAVLFGTVSALATRTTCVARVNRVQRHPCKSSLIREE